MSHPPYFFTVRFSFISLTGGFHGDDVGQIAVICRTNFTLFNNAVLTCTRNNKTRIGFAGVSIIH